MDPGDLYIDVILPLALPRQYTYRVDAAIAGKVCIGKRVVLQFGKKKIYTAIVERIDTQPPRDYKPKSILSVLDEMPIVNEKQFQLWKWIAEYYMCTHGEVMIAALPAGLKPESETIIALRNDFIKEHAILTDKEYLIAEALELHQKLTVTQVTKILDQKTVLHIVDKMIEKGIVTVHEELETRYKPKMDTFVKLTAEAEDEEWLKKIMDDLVNAPKQLELLMTYLQLSDKFSDGGKSEVLRPDLLKTAKASSGTLDLLIKKGCLLNYEKETGRIGNVFSGAPKNREIVLSEHQSEAMQQIKKSFLQKDVTLLHGVTSSGKTEIYITLMEEMLREGKQVLYLLPEIALTAQVVNRLQRYFGNQIGVYHSRFNDGERVEIWNAVLADSRSKFNIILGARSAVFLPFSNLGLIIVDEEHDPSYKQVDPAPRYNGRDTAIYLARLHGAKTLLGSATPSLETTYNAKMEKYGFSLLTKRFGDVLMPEIIIVNLKEETRKRRMRSHFSETLIEMINDSLKKREQVILFQNRRGFAPILQCNLCAWVPQCRHCDVSLTFHKLFKSLRCHYCGYSEEIPSKCAACWDVNLHTRGFGTEKIEEELALFFPKVRVSRMDLDTTRRRNSYRQLISDFENRSVDILVGTQMVTKGLDFDNVSLVGILNADAMLSFPDFRSFERSYQLMAQVSGRSGRKSKQGRVVIQTRNPDHPIIRSVLNNDYLSMYETEMAQREKFHYPPLFRLAELTLRHRERESLDKATGILALMLREKLGKRVLGPEYPLIGRIRGMFLKKILVKIEREVSLSRCKQLLQETINSFMVEKSHSTVRVHIDIDPQ